jgi:hypothetical protein
MKEKSANIYLIFILGILIVIFAIFKQLIMSDGTNVEGMANKDDEILRPDGHKVRRREKSAVIKESMMENYKEGIKIPGLSAITKGISTVKNGIKKTTRTVKNGIKKTTSGISNILKKIGKFFVWVGDTFVSLFSYVVCGFYLVIKFPQCFGWYALEALGHVLYIPFGFFFWVTGTQKIEKQIWNMIEQVDCFCYSTTGFHLIHYSDSIIKKCYNCKVKPFKKPPKF